MFGRREQIELIQNFVCAKGALESWITHSLEIASTLLFVARTLDLTTLSLASYHWERMLAVAHHYELFYVVH